MALRSAALITKMIVYPEGPGPLTDFLFTTATNRTEKTVDWEVPCHYTAQPDDAGHVHETLLYVNGSVQRPNGGWTNFVLFRNYCRDSWDLVYRHDFAGPQRDCSVRNVCGWWGPILETFMRNPQPPISELGFFGGMLFHDGEWRDLSWDETFWVAPASLWRELHRVPNASRGVGNDGRASKESGLPVLARSRRMASKALGAVITEGRS